MGNIEKLNELIPKYVFNKSEFDSYKKLCDADNATIKSIMAEEDITEFNAGIYTAKVCVSSRQSINEDKLLEVIKTMDRPDLIKTREYVDMDLLEKAIYNEEINAADLESCMTTKNVTTLRVTSRKE